MTAAEAKQYVDSLRLKYPDPQPMQDWCACDCGWRPSCYCVGGCLTNEIGERPSSFPSETNLGKALVRANPSLDCDAARRIATEITGNNDGRRFDKAWEKLTEALAYGSEP